MIKRHRPKTLGLVIDRDYLEIGFPLEPTAKSPHLVITGSVVFGGISLRN